MPPQGCYSVLVVDSDTLPTIDQGRRYLVVQIAGARYALPASAVRRVIQAPDLYPVPGARPRLLGLGQFGGEPLAVLDLQALDDESCSVGSSLGAVVVIAVGDEHMVGLAVDEALEVPTIPDENVVAGGSGPVIGTVKSDLNILDPEWFFTGLTDPGGLDESEST